MRTFKDAHTRDLIKIMEDLKRTIQGKFVLILVLFAYQLYKKYPGNTKYLQEPVLN